MNINVIYWSYRYLHLSLAPRTTNQNNKKKKQSIRQNKINVNRKQNKCMKTEFKKESQGICNKNNGGKYMFGQITLRMS